MKKLHGQEAHFRGVVQDDEGRHLEGLFRVIEGDTAKVARKFRHSFVLDVPPGSYRIEVSVRAHKSESYRCRLGPKQGHTHYFSLKPLGRIDVTGKGAAALAEAEAQANALAQAESEFVETEATEAEIEEVEMMDDADLVEDT